ncbi:hypothetical protein OPT61_g6578 [Boeremia exigua]|uniref:Uncharacterized protein n=1 Tax=Boeremia exigua TaxID=749465 RepID=A0ACC2I5J7_9PLEO|nr:hypothetical protein OPT61_g6578 [Boeremia exigua]
MTTGDTIVTPTIVIGVDFGTTYSGISWALESSTPSIRIISDWPNPWSTNANAPKVPSVISYDEDGSPPKWGYECDPSAPRVFRWFKLLLCNLRPVITIPAIWKESMKDKMRRIAEDAGIPDNLTFVSEPEAAALTILKQQESCGSLAVDDCFVICDAGGGTVDLISYKVLSLNPLSIEECAEGEGDLCGSFDKVKRTYTGDNNEILVTLFGVHDNSEYGIKRGAIMMTPTVLETTFEKVMSRVMSLLDGQRQQTLNAGSQIKAILLAGGFGMNRYLYKRIKETYACKNIDTLCAADAWASICQGATMHGLELSFGDKQATVQSRIMRYSYGICSHAESSSDTKMHWFLEKGTRIEVGQIKELPISSTVKATFSFKTRVLTETVYYCAYEHPPELKEDSKQQLSTPNLSGCLLRVMSRRQTPLRSSLRHQLDEVMAERERVGGLQSRKQVQRRRVPTMRHVQQ